MRATENVVLTIVIVSGVVVELVRHSLLLLLPLIVLVSHHNAEFAFLFKATEYLPNVLFGVFIGSLVDSVSGRMALVLSSVMIVAAVGLLGVGVHYQANPEILVAICLSYTAASYGFSNARHVYLKRTFEASRLQRVNSLIVAGILLVGIIGPFLVGMIVHRLSGSHAIFLFLPLLLILPIACSALPRDQTFPSQVKRYLWKRVFEALRDFWRSPTLLRLSVAAALFNTAESLLIASWILDAINVLGASSSEIAFLIALQLSGGLIGALIHARIGAIRRSCLKRLLIMFLLASAVFAVAPVFFPGRIGIALTGFGFVLFGSMLAINVWTIRQIVTSGKQAGAVLGVSSAVVNIGVPIAYMAAPNIYHSNRGFLYLLATLLVALTISVVRASNLGSE